MRARKITRPINRSDDGRESLKGVEGGLHIEPELLECEMTLVIVRAFV